jgi:CHASE3 domain sensor protein
MNFTHFKVSSRLAIGFGVVLLLLAVTAALSLTRLSSFNDQIHDLAEDKVTKVVVANDWLFSVMESARHTRNLLILDDREKILKELESLKKHKQLRADRMADLQKSVTTPEGKAKL